MGFQNIHGIATTPSHPGEEKEDDEEADLNLADLQATPRFAHWFPFKTPIAGSQQGMRIGMTPINHPFVASFQGIPKTRSFPTS